MPRLRATRRFIKHFLCTCSLPDSALVDGINHLLRYGRWLKANPPPIAFDDRKQLYDHVQRESIGEAPIAYLEFGVYRGDSFGHWLQLNRHPDSRFLGFDTFTGLPESWQVAGHVAAAGTFDVKGQIPRFDDPRARLVKGLFQETLPGVLADDLPALAANRLVVHLDADLYSSTLYVLTMLHACLKPGTILIFDEFNSAPHEFRAYLDFTSAYRLRCRLLGAAGRNGEQMAFVVEPDAQP